MYVDLLTCIFILRPTIRFPGVLLMLSLVNYKGFCACGAIRNKLNSSDKETSLKMFKVMEVQTLLFGCKNWTW